jgi:hypothetical protein
MRTKITQNIDGYDIIIGIGEAQIDGVATMPIVENALRETVEYKAVEAKKQELSVLINQTAQAMKNARDSKTQSEKNKYVAEYQQNQELQKGIESELKTLISPLHQKQHELILKHAVYFQPKEGETVISKDEADIIENAMITATNNDCYVDINLKQICDNRGKTAWSKSGGKWVKRDITVLGDDLKAGEILQNNLSEIQQSEISIQLEAERISKLSESDKLKEKESLISVLAARANSMRGELEIQGDSKALVKSQDWYKAEVSKVESKYS